ncbi:MAG: hypothetical protein JW810_09135 [Sedimentisphaerales bacterium]|nr:hypothetical protein [Sedimentisphaerales bacterium]
MPAARTSSEPKKSFIIAIVIFVVLFLAAAVAAVMLYMKQETFVKDRDTAKDKLAKIANGAEYTMVEALPERDPAGGRNTAIGVMIQDMRQISEVILGQDMSQADVVGLRDDVLNRLGPVAQSLAALPEPESLAASKGLAPIIQELIRRNQKLVDDLAQAENLLQQQHEKHVQDLTARDKKIEDLNSQLTAQTEATQQHETEYKTLRDQLQARYEGITNQMQQQITDLQAQLKAADDKDKKQTEEIEKYQAAVNKLNERLKLFQPSPEMEAAALEPDGYIVNMEEREKIAYINLAKGDQIYRGLKFTVYDRFAPIPKSGKGKGAIEVLEIMDTISKCRITAFDETNPIMTNDIIANLVWSRDKKYRFCVAGDFDFDGNGQPEADGRQKVIDLIQHWGGLVTDTLSVDTDFLVLGQSPALPTRPSEEYGMDSQVMRDYRQAQQRVQQYDEVRKNAEALDVPTFGLQRFFYFIGFYQSGGAVRVTAK